MTIGWNAFNAGSARISGVLQYTVKYLPMEDTITMQTFSFFKFEFIMDFELPSSCALHTLFSSKLFWANKILVTQRMYRPTSYLWSQTLSKFCLALQNENLEKKKG